MQTQLVYDFLNAHAKDAALQSRLARTRHRYRRGLRQGDHRVGERAWRRSHRDLVATWLSEAFAEYDSWIAGLDELSEDELDLVSGGSGTTTVGKIQCTAGYQCRSCCPGMKCNTCYCPINGSC